MGWAELPLEIIDKIISYAVKGDKDTEPYFHKRICEYGLVHSSWKRAIIFSRTIFQRDKSLLPEQWCPKTVLASNRQFIEQGYLPAVQSLAVNLEFCENLELVYDFIADRNSIERLGLTVSDLTRKTSRQINKFLKLLKKAKQFDITIRVFGTRREAKWLWELMTMVIHTNSHPKTINLCFFDSIQSTEWSFTRQNQRLNIGSISKLIVSYHHPPAGLFSNMANIDTVIVELQSILRPGNAFVENVNANCLQIKYDLKPQWTNNHLGRLLCFLDQLNRDTSQPSFKVKTVKCVVIMSDSSNRPMILWLSRIENQQTFEVDAMVWSKIKDWFRLTCQVCH